MIELRFLNNLHADKVTGRTLSGYAAMYEKISEDLGGFKEVIQRGAFKGAIGGDIIANINHDDTKILARTSNSNLEVREDPAGLFFELEIPDTSYGNDLLENVKNGNISKCSFAFEVGKDSWTNDTNGLPVRSIQSFKSITDISIVTTPAYEDTMLSVRAKEKPVGFVLPPETQERLDRFMVYQGDM